MEGTEKIIALAKELIAECEAQGFNTKGIEVKHLDVWDFGRGVEIQNCVVGWEIRHDGRVIRRETNE